MFDFAELSWIGSNLLGALIACYCSLRATGGGLRVTGVSQKIVDATAFNQLAEVVPVESTVDAAIRSLWDRPASDPPA